jgi:hypothetical protein
VDNKKIKRNLLRTLFIVGLLAIGIFIFFRPMILSGFRYSQQDTGDSVFNNLLLEHSFQVVFNHSYLGTAWSPIFYYPQGNVLAYSDNLWGSAPIYWLARAFFTPETAFQIWMIVVAILNFFAFYLLARSLKMNTWFSGFGSFLFAFCLPRLGQIGHQQLLPQFYSALALFFLFKFIQEKKFKHFLFFEICVYLQVLAGIYLGWFLLLSLPVLILVGKLFYKDKFSLRPFLDYRILISVLVFFAVLAVTLSPYYSAQKEIGPRSYSEVETLIPGVRSYVNIASTSILYNLYPPQLETATQNIPVRYENYLFLGFFVYFLLLVSIVGFVLIRRKYPDKTFWPPSFVVGFTLFAIITLISLRIPFTDYSFWVNVYKFVPGAGAIRAVIRAWTISYLFLFLAIMGLASLVYSRSSSRIFKVLLVAIGLIACLEQIDINPRYFDLAKERVIQTQIEQAVSAAVRENKIDAFYLRWGENQWFFDYELKAMWASMDLNVPTIDGYTGNLPMGYKSLVDTLSDRDISDWLRFKGVTPLSRKILILDSSVNGEEFTIDKAEILSLPF